MNALDLISSRLAAKKNFRVVATFADGSTRSHETETEFQAKNWAIGERRQIGRNLISRETGKTVHMVSVEILAI